MHDQMRNTLQHTTQVVSDNATVNEKNAENKRMVCKSMYGELY